MIVEEVEERVHARQLKTQHDAVQPGQDKTTGGPTGTWADVAAAVKMPRKATQVIRGTELSADMQGQVKVTRSQTDDSETVTLRIEVYDSDTLVPDNRDEQRMSYIFDQCLTSLNLGLSCAPADLRTQRLKNGRFAILASVSHIWSIRILTAARALRSRTPYVVKEHLDTPLLKRKQAMLQAYGMQLQEAFQQHTRIRFATDYTYVVVDGISLPCPDIINTTAHTPKAATAVTQKETAAAAEAAKPTAGAQAPHGRGGRIEIGTVNN